MSHNGLTTAQLAAYKDTVTGASNAPLSVVTPKVVRSNDHNNILLTDSYKATHWKQYQGNTSHIFSFFESRGGRYAEVTFFGLQYFIKKYLEGIVVTQDDIEEAREFYAAHFGDPSYFNEAGWQHIVDVHGGRLPVEIRAVAEGTTVPVSNVLMTAVNTDPKVPWLTNHLETLLSQVWYPTTVATQSREMKKTLLASLIKTGDPSLIDFMLHDFGYRGSTSVESAGIGGAAHLVNFKGTDTIAALQVARRFYHESMAGFSVPAAEHSTITSWGRAREGNAYEHILKQFPSGIVSIVGDSYDIYTACRDLFGSKLKQDVLMRDGTLVVRPDSGVPSEVVPEVLDILGQQFGSEENTKGYRVLNPKVRVIQGDGVDYQSIGNILSAMEARGWSADNLVFGSGGGLLQQVNRDTQKFAFKCSATCVDGLWTDVLKDPVTDRGKRSKAGRLMLIEDSQGFKTVRQEDTNADNLLVPVFKNGELLIDHPLSEIRERAAL